MNELTQVQKTTIDEMSQTEMCHLYRFAPSGHPYFVRGNPQADYFEKRFKELGGFTAEISKEIGWKK